MDLFKECQSHDALWRRLLSMSREELDANGEEVFGALYWGVTSYIAWMGPRNQRYTDEEGNKTLYARAVLHVSPFVHSFWSRPFQEIQAVRSEWLRKNNLQEVRAWAL